MAVHGQIGIFDSNEEDWQSHVERLKLYCIANSIDTEEKQRAILLSACGPATYRTIKNIVAPIKPAEKTFDDIVKLMGEHYNPKPTPTVQRCLFNARSRKQGETVAKFIAELKRLTEYCEFGDRLDEMMRDRLVCGINEERWQKRLLAEPNLTYKKAIDIAQALETAEKNVKDISNGKDMPPPRIHHVGYKERERSQIHKPGVGGKEVTSSTSSYSCYRCNGSHKATECHFKEATCHYCGKLGHIVRACRSKKRQDASHRSTSKPPQKHNQKRAHHLEVKDEKEDSEYTMYHISSSKAHPLLATVTLNGVETQMEIDTGAAMSVISSVTYHNLWSSQDAPVLKLDNHVKLLTYTGEVVKTEGTISVRVTYKNQKKELDLLVVQGNGPSLMGRDWLNHIMLDWPHLHQLSKLVKPWQEVIDRHPDVFKEELGLAQGVTAKIHIDPQAKPRFYKHRPVPYSLKIKVEEELDRLESQGVIEKTQSADWAAPIVPIVKPDGSIRICGDYKLTVNQASRVESYPLPRIEDIFASLSGGKLFTKLDLAHAYNQIPLDEESKKLVVINTQKGLYKYNRLPFGIASAPALFQRTIEGILQGIPNVSVYLDDILISGKTDEVHLKNLDEVLNRLEKAGLRLRYSKCAFMLTSIKIFRTLYYR